MLQNPTLVRTTSSFLIEVQDENSRGIALLTSGLVYTPTPGKVKDVKLISTKGKMIEQLVDLRLEFTPIHAVTGISFIKMKLPEQVAFSCTLKSNVGLKDAPACVEQESNLLIFEQPFVDDFYSGNIPLQITFRDMVLPGSNQMIRGILIETWVTLEDEEYLVDRIDNPIRDFFAPEQQLLLSSEVLTGSDEVYTATDFTFKHQLANTAMKDAIIVVTIPA